MCASLFPGRCLVLRGRQASLSRQTRGSYWSRSRQRVRCGGVSRYGAVRCGSLRCECSRTRGEADGVNILRCGAERYCDENVSFLCDRDASDVLYMCTCCGNVVLRCAYVASMLADFFRETVRAKIPLSLRPSGAGVAVFHTTPDSLDLVLNSYSPYGNQSFAQ